MRQWDDLAAIYVGHPATTCRSVMERARGETGKPPARRRWSPPIPRVSGGLSAGDSQRPRPGMYHPRPGDSVRSGNSSWSAAREEPVRAASFLHGDTEPPQGQEPTSSILHQLHPSSAVCCRTRSQWHAQQIERVTSSGGVEAADRLTSDYTGVLS